MEKCLKFEIFILKCQTFGTFNNYPAQPISLTQSKLTIQLSKKIVKLFICL